MRTGRKSRRKNRKSRGYIVPMCLALSGTLMAGTASADTYLGTELNGILEHGGSWNSDDEHRSITSDGDTVTLRNVGITNKNHHDQSWYYIDEFKAPEKKLVMDWDWEQEWGDPGQMGPVRSDVGRIEIEAKDLSLTSDFGPESENGQWNNKGLFADSPKGVPTPGILDVKVSGVINLKTGHFPIFADPGSITITGFKELNAEATGRMDGSGYVVRNVTVDGKPSTIRITGTPDSKISLLSQRRVNFHSKCKILGGVAEFFSKAFLCRFPPENFPRPVVYPVHSLPV